MPNRPFRFVHSSDFRLETPAHGVSEVPAHLRDTMLDAPYSAARRVFETTLAEEAAFLVLSGNVLQPQLTGPRGPAFLREQFARLAERGIAVFWAGGETDPPEAWPAALPLPENVHFFPRGRTAEIVYTRDGAPLARLVGTSRDGPHPLRPGEFQPDPGGLFSIAVAHGGAETAALQARGFHYWALGGQAERATRFSSPGLAHCPGSPQGRRFEEPGVHGCTLVEVDENGQTRPGIVPTDVLRWISERVVIDLRTSREDLEALLRQRIQALVETTPRIDLFIAWTIAGSGPLMAELRRGRLAADLLELLRVEYGQATPAAWSVSLEAEPAATLPAAWFEQETILGDFLRALRQCEMNIDEPLGLETYLAEAHAAGGLAAAATLADTATRQRVLRQAALLGVELLGDEAGQVSNLSAVKGQVENLSYGGTSP